MKQVIEIIIIKFEDRHFIWKWILRSQTFRINALFLCGLSYYILSSCRTGTIPKEWSRTQCFATASAQQACCCLALKKSQQKTIYSQAKEITKTNHHRSLSTIQGFVQVNELWQPNGIKNIRPLKILKIVKNGNCQCLIILYLSNYILF